MTPRERFAARLAARPLLLDGAMGTLLWSRGVPQLASLFELAETHPDLIGSIHREYLQAGADAIETETFGANRLRLAPFGLADRAAPATAARAARAGGTRRQRAGRAHCRLGRAGGGPIHGPERPRLAMFGRHFANRSRVSWRAASTCSCSRRSRT